MSQDIMGGTVHARLRWVPRRMKTDCKFSRPFGEGIKERDEIFGGIRFSSPSPKVFHLYGVSMSPAKLGHHRTPFRSSPINGEENWTAIFEGMFTKNSKIDVLFGG